MLEQLQYQKIKTFLSHFQKNGQLIKQIKHRRHSVNYVCDKLFTKKIFNYRAEDARKKFTRFIQESLTNNHLRLRIMILISKKSDPWINDRL